MGQLSFPAAQNPSVDANTLDDYEEGVWTPALKFGGNSVGMTYASTPVGRYTKIGRTVFATGTLTLTAKGSSTGSATITVLPFTSANDGIPAAAAIGHFTGGSAITGAVIGTAADGEEKPRPAWWEDRLFLMLLAVAVTAVAAWVATRALIATSPGS